MAAAREPRGRSWAGPSDAGARLAAPTTAVRRLRRASEKSDGGRGAAWQGCRAKLGGGGDPRLREGLGACLRGPRPSPWCTPPAAHRARRTLSCAREEDEFVVDLAGVPLDSRGRRRPASAREPLGRSWAGPSGAGARLAAPETAGNGAQPARQHQKVYESLGPKTPQIWTAREMTTTRRAQALETTTTTQKASRSLCNRQTQMARRRTTSAQLARLS